MVSRLVVEKELDWLFQEFLDDRAPANLVVADSPNVRTGGDTLECGSVETDEVYFPHIPPDDEEIQKQTIRDLARQLRDLGDKYQQQFGNSLNLADANLTTLFTQVSKLEYETFKNSVESLTTNDRNKADFVFMMTLCGSVVRNVGHYGGSLGSQAKIFFQRYIRNNYMEVLTDAGGVREFIQQN